MVRRISLALIAAFALFPVFIILETSVKPLVDVQNTFQWIPSHITFRPTPRSGDDSPAALLRQQRDRVGEFTSWRSYSPSLPGTPSAVLNFAAARCSRWRSFHADVPRDLVPPPALPHLRQRRPGDRRPPLRQLPGADHHLPDLCPALCGVDAGRFFSSIPRDIEEAALVDGASHWGALFRVVLPVARPGIIAVSVFAFMTAWGRCSSPPC